jgi:hypothetical protein
MAANVAEVSGQFDEISRRVAALAEEKSDLMARLKNSRPRACKPVNVRESDENQSPRSRSGPCGSGSQNLQIQHHGFNLGPDLMEGPKNGANSSIAREKGEHVLLQNDDASHIRESSTRCTTRLACFSMLNHIRNEKAGAIALINSASAEVVGLDATSVQTEQHRPIFPGLSSPPAHLSKEVGKSVRFSEILQAAVFPPKFPLDEQPVSAQVVHSSQAEPLSTHSISTWHADEEPKIPAKFEILIQAKDLEISSLLNQRRKAEERAAVLFSELGQSNRTVIETKRQLAEAKKCLEQLHTSRLEDAAVVRELELVHARQNTVISESSKKEEGNAILIRQLRSDLENARSDWQKLAEQAHQASALDSMLSAECERLEGALRTTTDQSTETIINLQDNIRKLTSEFESEKLHRMELQKSLSQEKEERLVQDARCESVKQDWLSALESMKSESAVTTSRNENLKALVEALNSSLHQLQQSLERQQAEHFMEKEAWALTEDSLRASIDRLRKECHSLQLFQTQLLHTLKDIKALHVHGVSSLQIQIVNSQTSLNYVRDVAAQTLKAFESRCQLLDDQSVLVLQSFNEQRSALMSLTAKQTVSDALVDSLQQSLAMCTQENTSLRETYDNEQRAWQVRAESLEASLEVIQNSFEAECKMRKDLTAELDQARKKTDSQQELCIHETTKYISEIETIRKNLGILLGQKRKLSDGAEHAKIIITDIISSLEELQEQHAILIKDEDAILFNKDTQIENLLHERDFFICECNSLKSLVAQEQLRYQQERSKLLANNNEIQHAFESLQTASNHDLKHYKVLQDKLLASENLVSELQVKIEDQAARFESERNSVMSLKICGESTVKELTDLNNRLSSLIDSLNIILLETHSKYSKLQSEAAKTNADVSSKVIELQQALDREVNEKLCLRQELEAEQARRLSLSITETKMLEALKSKDDEVQNVLSKLLAMEHKLKSTEMDLENACQAVYHSLKHEEAIGAALTDIIECWNTHPFEGFDVLVPPEMFREIVLENRTTEFPGKPSSLILISYLQEIILRFIGSYRDLQSHQHQSIKGLREFLQVDDDKVEPGLGEKQYNNLKCGTKNNETIKELQDKVITSSGVIASAKYLQQHLVQQILAINQDLDCLLCDVSFCQYNIEVLRVDSKIQQATIFKKQKNVSNQSCFEGIILKRENSPGQCDPALLKTPTMNEFFLSFVTMIQQSLTYIEQLHEIGCQLQQEYVSYKTKFLNIDVIESESKGSHPRNESRQLEALILRNGTILHPTSSEHVGSIKCVDSFRVGDQNLDPNLANGSSSMPMQTLGNNRSSEALSQEYIRKEILPKFAVLTYERNTAHEKAQELTHTIALLEKELCLLKKTSKDKSKLLQELRALKRQHEDLQGELQRLERAVIERNNSQQEVQFLSERLSQQAEEIEYLKKAISEQAKTVQEFRDLKVKLELLKEEKLHIEQVARDCRLHAQQESKILEEKVVALNHEVSQLSIAAAGKKTVMCELRHLREQYSDQKKENLGLKEVAAQRLKIINDVLSIAHQAKELQDDIYIFAEISTEIKEQQIHFDLLKMSHSQSQKENEELAKSVIYYADQLAVKTRSNEKFLLEFSQMEQQVRSLNKVCLERDQALAKLRALSETVCNLEKEIETNLHDREASYQEVRHLALELNGLRSKFLELERAKVADGQQFESRELKTQQESKKNEGSCGQRLVQKIPTKIRFLNPVCFQLPCNELPLSPADETRSRAKRNSLILRIQELEQSEVQLQALVAEGKRNTLELESELRENTVELFDRNSEIESLKSRITLMERRLERKDFEIESAVQQKENQIVHFLRAVEAKTAKKDSELEETRARLLRAEAALAKMVRQSRRKTSSTGSSISICSESGSP